MLKRLLSFKQGYLWFGFLLLMLGASQRALATEEGTLSWKYTVGEAVASSPAILENGTIYFGAQDNHLYAINLDGTLSWKYETGGMVNSSPAIAADGTVYVGSEDTYLYAFAGDGTLKWRYKTGSAINKASPAIGADGTVYIGSSDSNFYSINPDGTLKWKYETNGSIDSSPAIGSDGTIYIGSKGMSLYALDSNGNLVWEYKTKGNILSSPAIGSDGTIYFGSNDYKLYAVNPDGSLKWAYTTGGPVASSPTIGADGTIYIGSNAFYAIQSNGSILWKYQTDSYIESTTAIGSNGNLFVGSNDQKIYSFETDGKIDWTFDLDVNTVSSPIIDSNGIIYVGANDGFLYAIYSDSSGLAGSSWPVFLGNLRHTGVLEETSTSKDTLIADFGSAHGIYQYDEEGGWSKLSDADPLITTSLDIDGDDVTELVAAFQGYGTYLYDDDSWSQISAAVAEDIIPLGQQIAIDFGSAYGLYTYDTTNGWERLSPDNPGQMTTWDMDGDGIEELVIVFPGYGVYIYSDSWTQINEIPADNVVGIEGGPLVADFGSAYGLWTWEQDNDWTQLSASDPREITLGVDIDDDGASEFAVSFDGYGLYSYDGGWSQLSNIVPEQLLAASGGKLIVDFGSQYGLYEWTQSSGWTQLAQADPELMCELDLDGDGAMDLVATFVGFGIYLLDPDSGDWTEMSRAVAETILRVGH